MECDHIYQDTGKVEQRFHGQLFRIIIPVPRIHGDLRRIEDSLNAPRNEMSAYESADQNWRQVGDGLRVSRDDCHNFMSLERPSPSEVVMDKPSQIHQRILALAWRHVNVRMIVKDSLNAPRNEMSAYESADQNWRQVGDGFCVSKGDCDSFTSLEKPSRSEVVMDKPLPVHQRFRTLAWREASLEKKVILASAFPIWRHLDKSRDSKHNPHTFDLFMSLKRPNPSEVVTDKPFQVHEGFPNLAWIEDIFTKSQRQSTFPYSADVQGIANHSKLITGVYRNDQAHVKVTFQMEDCAFNGKGNRWLKEVKFRIQKSHVAPRNNPKNPWMDLHEIYPNAEVEMKRNIVKVTIDSPQENHEFAVFGIPDVNDRKRMQVGLFGEKPLQGEDWKIWVILFDDTMMAFQHVCKMEEGRGRELLTTLAGLFVFNSCEDIKINVMDVELGWKIKDGNEKVIKSNDAWNSPENSADFPCCHFEVSQVDQGKKTFTCGVTVSHKQDSAEVEVTAVFEEPKKDREELHLPFAGDIAADDFSDVLVFLQMFAMAMWFINAAVQPGVLLDPN